MYTKLKRIKILKLRPNTECGTLKPINAYPPKCYYPPWHRTQMSFEVNTPLGKTLSDPYQCKPLSQVTLLTGNPRAGILFPYSNFLDLPHLQTSSSKSLINKNG